MSKTTLSCQNPFDKQKYPKELDFYFFSDRETWGFLLKNIGVEETSLNIANKYFMILTGLVKILPD